MTTRSFLTTRIEGTTGARRLTNGSTTSVGSSFGSAEGSSAGGTSTRCVNRGIKFFNRNGSTIVERLEWINNQIRSFDGSTWTLRHTTSVAPSPAYCHSGLYVTTTPSNGDKLVIGLYHDGTNARGVQSADGITWTETNLGVVTAPTNWFCESLVLGFDSKGLAVEIDVGTIFWNPGNLVNTFQFSVTPDVAVGPRDYYADSNGPVYMLAERVSQPGYWLWWNAGIGVGASAWIPFAQLPCNGSVANQWATWGSASLRPLLFLDRSGTYLTAIYCDFQDAMHYGFKAATCTRNTTSPSITDVSAGILPAGWAFSGTPPSLYNFDGVTEFETSPAQATTHIFARIGTSGSVIERYLFHESYVTLIGSSGSPNDSGDDSSLSIAHAKDGALDRLWMSKNFDIRIIAFIPRFSTMVIQFLAFGPTDVEVKSVKFYIDGVLVSTLASPSVVYGPSSAPTVSGGNQLDGVTCDGKSATPTLYQVEFDGYPGFSGVPNILFSHFERMF